MAKNIELMKQIKGIWDRTPEEFDMGSWETNSEGYKYEIESGRMEPDEIFTFYDPQSDAYDIEVPAEHCGTTRCMAGWAIHLSAVEKGIDPTLSLQKMITELGYGQHDYVGAGKDLLGLDHFESKVFFAGASEAYERLSDWIEGDKKHG